MEIYFQHLDGATNLTFYAGKYLCKVYPLQSREKTVEICMNDWSVATLQRDTL